MNRQFRSAQKEIKPQNMPGLKIIPLGGIGDVTKNMYIYEYKGDILIVDCGVGFPDEAMPGIDLLIPDITYLRDKKSQIRGFVITHGHDDHIGGLPYIWPEIQVPIYAQRLAAAFIKAKFVEHKLPLSKINTVTTSTQLNLGAFRITFFQVAHSVPDSTGLIIETPAGRVVHMADFRMDWTPVNGQITQVGKMARAGDEGVTLMMVDALRSERAGYGLSESTILPTFTRIEAETKGKMIITTTSSNITRIQQAISVAVKAGRHVALIGRSMENNFQVARDLGYIEVPPGVVISPDEVKRYPSNKLLIIIAGAWGQPGSALSRVANNDHRFITIKPDDGVVFSADPIPSSEAAQNALIDKLTKLGAEVYYTAMTDNLHVSGHASQEEIKVAINIVRPQYLIPIGATYRQMKVFARMAYEMGWRKDEVLLLDDGQVISVVSNQVRVDGKVEAKNVYIDGLGVGDIGNVVLRDRRVMSEEGIVLVVVPIDTQTSQLVGEPDVISRGFVFEKEADGLLDEAKKVIKDALSDHPQGILDWRFTRRHIEETLDQFFFERTGRRPMVLPVVVEV